MPLLSYNPSTRTLDQKLSHKISVPITTQFTLRSEFDLTQRDLALLAEVFKL